MNWFKSKVNHKADWDIKRKEPWEKTVETPFPGSYDTKIVVDGSITTPEEIGNMMYGYTGTAANISETVLIGGSMYAAGNRNYVSSSNFERSREIANSRVFVLLGKSHTWGFRSRCQISSINSHGWHSFF
ncbi:MAG: polymorphic toxin type 44 domain-containing protein [Thermincola sp.]|nr:polymorphic toxin type 44 domain-containing protein [Thermincola sp.]MDT3704514.1 polymorphic toxin type 44 domain-containing protein [Thermincola sp.]